MKETSCPISTLEIRTLRTFTLLAAVFFLAYFVEAAIHNYQSSRDPTKMRIAVHDPVPRMPAGLHLLTIPIFLSVIRPRNFYVATLLTVSYTGLLILSFYLRVDGESYLGGPIPGDPGFFQGLYYKTWIWDYVGVGFLAVMLPWLSSIIYRSHRRGPRKLNTTLV